MIVNALFIFVIVLKMCLFKSGGVGQFTSSICYSALNEDTSVCRQNNLQNQVSVMLHLMITLLNRNVPPW